MLRTLDCEAVLFGCRTFDAHAEADGSCVPAPGADHLLGRLPAEHWGLLVGTDPEIAAAHLAAADLPQPGLIRSFGADDAGDGTFTAVAEGLGADPFFCLALVETPEHVDAALDAGMKVIGLATAHRPDELGRSDMVVPTLHSLRVVGTHPVLVLEVDALPGVGTFNPGRFGRR